MMVARIILPRERRIVYRASRPEGDEVKEYHDLLKQGLVKPTKLEIYVYECRWIEQAAGHAFRCCQVFRHIGRQMASISIFSSNYLDPKGRAFDLFMSARRMAPALNTLFTMAEDSIASRCSTRDGKKARPSVPIATVPIRIIRIFSLPRLESECKSLKKIFQDSF